MPFLVVVTGPLAIVQVGRDDPDEEAEHPALAPATVASNPITMAIRRTVTV